MCNSQYLMFIRRAIQFSSIVSLSLTLMEMPNIKLRRNTMVISETSMDSSACTPNIMHVTTILLIADLTRNDLKDKHKLYDIVRIFEMHNNYTSTRFFPVAVLIHVERH